MTPVERDALNRVLTGMNIGVTPTGDQRANPNAAAPFVRIEPTARTGPKLLPSQRGEGQDQVIGEPTPRVGQPYYKAAAPPARDVPGRAGLDELEQRALDGYMMRTEMTPELEKKIKDFDAEQLRKFLKTAIINQPAEDRQRAEGRKPQRTNVPDPRRADFDHNDDEGGNVRSRWSGTNKAEQGPSPREIGEAKDVAEDTGEPIELYGNSFGGVDGTIGNPKRLYQQKSAPDVATLGRVIAEAKQNAQSFGDRWVEVHVVAPEISLSQATDYLRANPIPPYGSWLSRVVVHVRGGFFVVPSSGVP